MFPRVFLSSDAFILAAKSKVCAKKHLQKLHIEVVTATTAYLDGI